MREPEWALREYARSNRRSMNDAETRLWFEIRRGQLGARFRRQFVIGPYIVDFVCLAKKLVIEVDGSQHAGSVADEKRDRYLAERGYRVLRVWSWDVMGDIDGVLSAIVGALSPAATMETK